MKRVLTARFMHETNTFSRVLTDMAMVRRRDYHLENEIPEAFRGTRSAFGATFEAADKFGWSLVHPVSANPNPSGIVTDEAFEQITAMILDAVEVKGPIDGVLLHLHGAMVSATHEDAEGGHCQVGSFDRVWQALSMTTSPNPYRGFRFPPAVIEHAVWLYHCFSLSLRDVELILSARGIVVSYESIREWGLRFGRIFANALKRRRPQPGDKWYMDEVFIRIRGKQHYLWRAVDQAGNVLDILVQSRRNAAAAMRFFRKLLKGLRYVPRVSSQTSSRATPPPNARSC